MATPSTATQPEESSNIFLELLRTIPDTQEARQSVSINDYGLAWAEVDYPVCVRPTSNPIFPTLEECHKKIDVPAILDFPRLSPAPFLTDPSLVSVTIPARRFLGFEIWDVDQTVLAGVPPSELEVLRGRFNPEASDRALNACAECEPSLRQIHEGISFHSWGEDLYGNLTKRLAPPAFDAMGRGGRVAILEDYVFRAVETAGLTSLIDAYQGKRSSLADVEEYRAIAKHLSELGVYSAYLSDRTQSLEQTDEDLYGSSEDFYTPEELARRRRELRDSPMLRPYEVFGTAAGIDEEGRFMALVLMHRDPGRARENVALLRQRVEETKSVFWDVPWSELVEEIEVRSDGRAVVAILRGNGIYSNWLTWVYHADPLLLHE